MKHCYLFLFAILCISVILYPFVGGIVYEGLTGSTTTASSTTTTLTLYGPNNTVAMVVPGTSITTTSISGTKTTYNYVSAGSTSGTLTVNNYASTSGDKGVVISNSSGVIAVQITLSSSTTPVMYYPNTQTSEPTSSATPNGDFNVFTAPNGDMARLITGGKADLMIVTQKSTGDVDLFYMDPEITSTSTTKFYGPNAQTATVNVVDGKQQITVVHSDQSSSVFVVTTGSSGGSTSQTSTSQSTDTTSSSQPEPMTTASSLSSSTVPNSYQSSQTSQGDKYILKSSIVPPVCPICPQPII